MKTLTVKEEEIMGYFWEKGPLFVKQFMGHRTKRILRIERKEYQTY